MGNGRDRSILSDPTRECGSCTACCAVLGVPELGKGTYEVCTHVCRAGCAIYADRPHSCRTFACEWLRGVLEVDGRVDDALRPDACGVIFDYQPESAFGEVYKAWECEPGASDRGPASDILGELAEHFLVMVMECRPAGEKGVRTPRFRGPRQLVARASEAMSKNDKP